MAKIYFDTCCINRPFDDQTQVRVRLEAEEPDLEPLHLSREVVAVLEDDDVGAFPRRLGRRDRRRRGERKEREQCRQHGAAPG